MSMRRTRVVRALIAASLLLISGAASAVPVRWVFDGVTFEEQVLDINFRPTGEIYTGAALTGSFVYDADTNAYSDINIIADPWQSARLASFGAWSYTGNDYTYEGPSISSPSSTAVILRQGFAFAFGFSHMELSLLFASGLTNSGGTIFLDTYPGSYDRFNSQDVFIADRAIVGGTVIGTVVPLPAALWLFASGLGLLGWFRRKRTS